MQKKIWLLALAMVGAVLLSGTTAWADSDFYVIAGGGQPVGTKITSLPYTILASGSYYLGNNLSAATGAGIIIDANDVTLDLRGFCLAGNFSEDGIKILDNRRNVEVRNGTLSGWNNGVNSNGGCSNLRIIGVRANGNINGIIVQGDGTQVKGCTASWGGPSAGTKGIFINGSGLVRNCTVMGFAGANGVGIYSLSGGTISDNLVLNCNGTGAYGIKTDGPATISRNSVISCSKGIYAQGGSIIGNAVYCATGIGSDLSVGLPTVVDQNSLSGEGGWIFYPELYKWGVNGFMGWQFM